MRARLAASYWFWLGSYRTTPLCCSFATYMATSAPWSSSSTSVPSAGETT